MFDRGWASTSDKREQGRGPIRGGGCRSLFGIHDLTTDDPLPSVQGRLWFLPSPYTPPRTPDTTNTAPEPTNVDFLSRRSAGNMA